MSENLTSPFHVSAFILGGLAAFGFYKTVSLNAQLAAQQDKLLELMKKQDSDAGNIPPASSGNSKVQDNIQTLLIQELQKRLGAPEREHHTPTRRERQPRSFDVEPGKLVFSVITL